MATLAQVQLCVNFNPKKGMILWIHTIFIICVCACAFLSSMYQYTGICTPIIVLAGSLRGTWYRYMNSLRYPSVADVDSELIISNCLLYTIS